MKYLKTAVFFDDRMSQRTRDRPERQRDDAELAETLTTTQCELTGGALPPTYRGLWSSIAWTRCW